MLSAALMALAACGQTLGGGQEGAATGAAPVEPAAPPPPPMSARTVDALATPPEEQRLMRANEAIGRETSRMSGGAGPPPQSPAYSPPEDEDAEKRGYSLPEDPE